MPRIPATSDANASPEAAALFGALKSKIGMVPNLYRTTGTNPGVLAALLGLGAALDTSGFTPSEVEAVALSTAGANGCDYCASAHTAVSKMQKRDAVEISANLAGKSSDPRIAAILKLSRAIIATHGKVSDAVLAEARLAGLSDADLIETVAQTVRNIFTNYLNDLAHTDIDFPVVSSAAA